MASVTLLMVQSWKACLFVQLLVDKTAKRLSGRLCIWYGKSDIPFYILAKVHEEKVRKINIVKHADLWKSPHAHVASSNTSKELWLSNVFIRSYDYQFPIVKVRFCLFPIPTLLPTRCTVYPTDWDCSNIYPKSICSLGLCGKSWNRIRTWWRRTRSANWPFSLLSPLNNTSGNCEWKPRGRRQKSLFWGKERI